MMKKFLLFIPLLLAVACTKDPSNIKYTASGDGPAGITVDYVDGNGIHQSYTGASPWESSFTAKSGTSLSVSGGSGSFGTSSVHIYINGVDKANDTETGNNATAKTTVP